MLWSIITKRRRNAKINEQVKKYLITWILQHPQVLQSPIVIYCLKLSIDIHSESQLAPKFLLQVSVWLLHNSMVTPPEEGGLKDAVDVDNNIIISDLTPRSIITPQLKNMSARHKVMCSCECCISTKSMNSSLL